MFLQIVPVVRSEYGVRHLVLCAFVVPIQLLELFLIASVMFGKYKAVDGELFPNFQRCNAACPFAQQLCKLLRSVADRAELTIDTHCTAPSHKR